MKRELNRTRKLLRQTERAVEIMFVFKCLIQGQSEKVLVDADSGTVAMEVGIH